MDALGITLCILIYLVYGMFMGNRIYWGMIELKINEEFGDPESFKLQLSFMLMFALIWPYFAIRYFLLIIRGLFK